VISTGAKIESCSFLFMEEKEPGRGRLRPQQVAGLLAVLHALQMTLWTGFLAERGPHHRFNPVLHDRALPAHWLLLLDKDVAVDVLYDDLCQHCSMLPPELWCLLAHRERLWGTVSACLPVEFQLAHPDFPWGEGGGAMPNCNFKELSGWGGPHDAHVLVPYARARDARGPELLKILNDIAHDRFGWPEIGYVAPAPRDDDEDEDDDGGVRDDNRQAMRDGILMNPRASQEMLLHAMFSDEQDMEDGWRDSPIIHNPLNEVDEDLVAMWEALYREIDSQLEGPIGVADVRAMIYAYVWLDRPRMLEFRDSRN
jgi:hypothetical protein